MSETTLTREKILEAAEDVLRRYGPSKATVVDVARALGVSHGSVYRHFASKAALRDAVTQIWLERFLVPLEAIVAEDAPAEDRLGRWLRELTRTKQQIVLDDPELFATYAALAAEARDVFSGYMSRRTNQLVRLIEDGNARGEWTIADPAVVSRAIFSATARFHDPAHASEWTQPGMDTALEEVWFLLLMGLKASSSHKHSVTNTQENTP